jgi:hypothetical protein
MADSLHFLLCMSYVRGIRLDRWIHVTRTICWLVRCSKRVSQYSSCSLCKVALLRFEPWQEPRAQLGSAYFADFLPPRLPLPLRGGPRPCARQTCSFRHQRSCFSESLISQ